MFKELKEIMFKELKDHMTTMTNNLYKEMQFTFLKEPNTEKLKSIMFENSLEEFKSKFEMAEEIISKLESRSLKII